jgi:archaeal type IV pilus assembly protein PilA
MRPKKINGRDNIMANFKNNEEGLSAVIGVILMVAITVILAAVISAFSFTMANDMPTTHNLGTLVDRSNLDLIYI